MFDRFPVIVFWETTQACELKCLHCRASSIWERNPEELNTEEGKKLLENLSGFEKKPVIVFTGGNPLIREDIYELISYAKSLGLTPALAPTVSERLNSESLKELKDAGVKYISISLDGAKPETHELIRGEKGHFEATLKALREALSYGFDVQVNTAVMSLNKREVGGVFKIIKDLGVKTWEVFFIVAVGRAYANLEMSPSEYEAVCNFLYDASFFGINIRTVECPFIRRVYLERSRGFNRSKDDNLYLELKSSLYGYSPSRSSTINQYGTLDGDGVIFISYNGSVYPSGLLNVSIGNVRNDDIVRIYRENDILKKFRKREFNGYCGSCDFRFNCGGSRSRAYYYYKDPLGSDPACVLVSR
ncbi:MAG: TIGR04053 family radical SAM/SPASM domain-containing protein [Nitrososphaeria archaeon]